MIMYFKLKIFVVQFVHQMVHNAILKYIVDGIFQPLVKNLVFLLHQVRSCFAGFSLKKVMNFLGIRILAEKMVYFKDLSLDT